ncbi:hypothetical protein Clacol_003612 [Clathrus columnatus]|uniref:DUF3752 domain-containing protein n=1 Tax=Clathrus columnatus TaxID=1419009 RepID=A0AAV5A528_9AGAM|nr:hypothetical protein Clacol_003612 [Clathrus columnatus]
MSSIGPQIPAHLLRKPEEKEEEESDNEDEDEDDAYAPDLPPDLKRPNNQEEEEPSDDEIGPKPIKVRGNEEDDDPVREFMERESRRKKAQEEEAKPQKLQREEWMLVPPSSSNIFGSLDPTKLKARQFTRNPTAKTHDNSLWTETPAQKQARIRDEVEGKRKRATDVEDSEIDLQSHDKKRNKYTEELASQVENYNRKNRGTSLMEMHQSKQEKKKEESENVIWDRERDMSVGGRLMDERQRSKMVQDARGLSSRFSKSKGEFL